jgi:hypothetical protein
VIIAHQDVQTCAERTPETVVYVIHDVVIVLCFQLESFALFSNGMYNNVFGDLPHPQ